MLISSTNFHLDGAELAGVVALFVLAGSGLGLAIRFPFTLPRFASGWLLFAAVAFIPAAHFW